MSRSMLICAIAAWMLTGCACGTQPTPALYTPIPANLRAPPEELPPAPSGKLPDLWENHEAVTQIYHDLADRYLRLNRAINFREKLQQSQGEHQ